MNTDVRIFIHTGAAIKKAYDWLRNTSRMCNAEFGTPFERCMNISDTAMINCREKLGPIKPLCHVTQVFSLLCYTTKVVDAVCVLVGLINDSSDLDIMASKYKIKLITEQLKTNFCNLLRTPAIYKEN